MHNAVYLIHGCIIFIDALCNIAIKVRALNSSPMMLSGHVSSSFHNFRATKMGAKIPVCVCAHGTLEFGALVTVLKQQGQGQGQQGRNGSWGFCGECGGLGMGVVASSSGV